MSGRKEAEMTSTDDTPDASPVLDWSPAGDGEWFAPSFLGGDGYQFEYVITRLAADYFDIISTDEELRRAGDSQFRTLDDAKAECQRVEDQIWAENNKEAKR